jgi:Ca-activated chloride channel homolog
MIRRWLVLPAVFMMAGAMATATQETVFTVKAEEVRVDVLVTENGKPLRGLSADDFEILDNGVPQAVNYATLQTQAPLSTTLVFDMSRSVAGSLLEYLRNAAQRFLADLKNGDYAALITFNNAVVLGSPPTQDLERIRQALDKAQAFGNSSLIDGSYAGLVIAESRPDQPLIIIFSDGRDTFSWLTGNAVLETARRNDAVVYAVSTAHQTDKTFLNELTKLTGGSLFEVKSNKDLTAAFLSILGEFRQRYLIAYTPKGVSEIGWHKVDVHLKHSSAKVSARPGYMRTVTGE